MLDTFTSGFSKLKNTLFRCHYAYFSRPPSSAPQSVNAPGVLSPRVLEASPPIAVGTERLPTWRFESRTSRFVAAEYVSSMAPSRGSYSDPTSIVNRRTEIPAVTIFLA